MAQLSHERPVSRRTGSAASPRRAPARAFFWGLTGLALAALLWWAYARTSRSVTLQVGQHAFPLSTHHPTVATLLDELQIPLQPEDIVQPPPSAPLAAGDTITIQLARSVALQADGQQQTLFSHQPRLEQLLAEIGLKLQPGDELTLDGQPAPPDAALPPVAAPATTGPATTPRDAVAALRPPAVNVAVRRAIPVALQDGAIRTTFYTARPTVAEALAGQNISVLAGDRVSPPPETTLSPGMSIFIQRATPLVIQADGEMFEVRTQGDTVAQVLAEQGIALMGQDFSRPPLDAPISAHDTIEIVRVRELVEFDEEYLDFETEWVPDDTLELDQSETRETGATGIIRRRTRVRFENGAEISREFEDEWLAQQAQNQVIAYGTHVVVRTLETPAGPIEYWRKIPMRATAYSAATTGKDTDHPRYGITRSGLPAGKGVAAVDPRVIPLHTPLYVPDYGQAVAGDTGGRIRGRMIDLGYADDEPLPVIYGWRDVYLLTPVPPADRIRYVLPDSSPG